MGKERAFWVKNSVVWGALIYGMYYKNNAFVAKIVNTRLAKVFMVIFALAEMLPISATLTVGVLTCHDRGKK